jgi:hypothetical protein
LSKSCGDPYWENHDELMGWSIARDLLGAEAAKADYVP